MGGAGLLDLQYREKRLRCQIANQLEFSIGEYRHHANLNRNWTTSDLLPRHKHNCAKRERESAKPQSVVFENGEEAIAWSNYDSASETAISIRKIHPARR